MYSVEATYYQNIAPGKNQILSFRDTASADFTIDRISLQYWLAKRIVDHYNFATQMGVRCFYVKKDILVDCKLDDELLQFCCIPVNSAHKVNNKQVGLVLKASQYIMRDVNDVRESISDKKVQHLTNLSFLEKCDLLYPKHRVGPIIYTGMTN